MHNRCHEYHEFDTSYLVSTTNSTPIAPLDSKYPIMLEAKIGHGLLERHYGTVIARCTYKILEPRVFVISY